MRDVVVLIDREQGGEAHLAKAGLKLHAAFKLSAMLAVLLKHKLVRGRGGVAMLSPRGGVVVVVGWLVGWLVDSWLVEQLLVKHQSPGAKQWLVGWVHARLDAWLPDRDLTPGSRASVDARPPPVPPPTSRHVTCLHLPNWRCGSSDQTPPSSTGEPEPGQSLHLGCRIQV